MNSHLLLLGGPLLWFILLLGFVALLVYLERRLHLHRARIDATDFLQGIYNLIRRNNVTEALALCEETPGPVARLTASAIQRQKEPRERLLEELDQVGRAEISRMERRLSLLALIAQIAPLAGLLGVVLSILKSLLWMHETAPLIRTADLTMGLIPGAIATVAGLLVAIPSFIAFHLLIIQIDRLVLDMRDAASDLVFFFDARREETAHDA